MCDPVTIALSTAAVAAATTGLSYAGQQQRAASTAQAANLNFANNSNALGAQATQVDEQHSENALSTIIEGAKNAGRISAGASSLSLGASSTAGQENANDVDIGRSLAIGDLNQQNKDLQIGMDVQSAGVARQSQIAQAPPPSLASLVVGLGDAAVKGANTYASVGGKF